MKKFNIRLHYALLLFLISVSFAACGPMPPPSDPPPIKKIESRNLPPGTSGTVFFKINGATASTVVVTPYSFSSAYRFYPNVTTTQVVNDTVNSGVYFRPTRALDGVMLLYDKFYDDTLYLNYVTGEMWTEFADGYRSEVSFGYLLRTNYKEFNDWSTRDAEIVELNKTLRDTGQRQLVAGDEIYVQFVIVYSALNGTYTQLFHIAKYELK